jgi:hypothetical protein
MAASVDTTRDASGTKALPTECDLIMKGGITSGIVYPSAVAEIARFFRLRSIGGTSAGAIAAAAAAAAELGRQRSVAAGTPAYAPFEELQDLPRLLGAPSSDGKRTRLLAFFEPSPDLRPAFDAFVAASQSSKRGVAAVRSMFRSYWSTALVGLVLGLLPLWFIPRTWGTVLPQLTAVLFACAISLGLVMRAFWRAVARCLPQNYFGVCSGMPTADDKYAGERLTPWLHAYYNTLCRQEQEFTSDSGMQRVKPLTFGDLDGADIHLQMMTTCLTLGRPFRLPFRDDHQVRENNQFWYKEAEFRELFPAEVVDWMVTKERSFKDSSQPHTLQKVSFKGFRCLPRPEDLPVVVGVRMSLSFPILLSAVPLYSVDFRAPAEARKLERCWFTDGGVGSNFPIHFFDSPLPTRPTFGLDLGERSDASDKAVVLPATNGDARLAYWRRFECSGFKAIAGFLAAVVNVAKDWNHETLGHMPGFRDRIALIRLTREQGGLNLAMPEKQITQLSEYGREAGQEFVRRFGRPVDPSVAPAETMNWENHQLVRLRLFLGAMSESVVALLESAQQADVLGFSYDRFFHGGDYGPEAYRFTGLRDHSRDPHSQCEVTQAGLALAIYDALKGIGRHTSRCAPSSPVQPSKLHPATGAPKPPPELRLRPRV